MQIRRTIIALICLLPVAISGAASLSNGDFEGGLTGWEVQGQANVSKDKPAQGQAALALHSDGKSPAWACSAPLAEAPAGQLVTLSFAIRRPQGEAALALSLVSDPRQAGSMVVWQALPPADANWHSVSLLLKLPPLPGGAPRLAFGALGPAGLWQVDNVNLEPGTPPAAQPLDLTGQELKTEVLPPGWVPEGNLDARVKEIANEAELIINVNGIEVGARPSFTCTRGHREGLVLFAVNRGQIDKDLEVKVAAPAGVVAPAWTVPIKGGGTTRFHTVIQSLRQGEFWIRLTCASAGQSASLPIRVTCRRSYPVLGALWRDRIEAAELQAVAQLPLDLQVLCGAPDLAALEPMARQAQAVGAEFMLAPLAGSLSAPQYLAALGQLTDKLAPSYWLPSADEDTPTPGSAAPQLVSALRKQQAQAGVFSAPYALSYDWQQGKLLPDRANLLTAERTAGVQSVTCRLPQLAPACVLAEQLDGKPEALSGAAASQMRQSDLAAMRALLQERRLMLPMLVDGLGAASSGDARLDALHLARTVTNIFYQGSSGLLLRPQRGQDNAFGPLPLDAAEPVPMALRLLSEELAGCEPLVALADTADASVAGATPITYRPFRRGGEGIVVLWNNTSTPRDVTLEFRSEPLASQRLLLSYSDQFAVQRWEPIMKFSEEAFKRRQPAVFIRLDPLQVQVHSFRLLNPSPGWLRSVSLTAPFVAPRETPEPSGKEERPWWRDMLKGRQSPL